MGNGNVNAPHPRPRLHRVLKAMAVQWYPLPEVSPKEEGWWEEKCVELLSDIKVAPTTSTSLTFQSTPTMLERDGTPTTDLSISTLLTTTCASLAPNSSFNLPGTSEISHESNYTKKSVNIEKAKRMPKLETVTELDGLWKRFLSSTIAGKENRGGVAKCACAGTQHKARMEREELVTDFSSETSSSKTQCLQTRSVLIERAVQTSPLLTQPVHRQCSTTSLPSVMFTVASKHPAKTKPTELSLSEALALSHPEFIEASLRRQREIKRWQRLHMQCNQSDLRPKLPNKDQQKRQPPYGGPLKSAPPRSKMSKLEMYNASKRVWSQLPEVQAKVLAEKRKSQAETNRIRVKLYQQEVLSRMRRLNKNKQ